MEIKLVLPKTRKSTKIMKCKNYMICRNDGIIYNFKNKENHTKKKSLKIVAIIFIT